MNRYQPPMHRSAFAVAAVAMTVLTLGLSVVAPAKLASIGQDARTLAGPNPVTRAPTEIAAHPARIEVIGVREQNTAYEPVREVSRNPKQQG